MEEYKSRHIIMLAQDLKQLYGEDELRKLIRELSSEFLEEVNQLAQDPY